MKDILFATAAISDIVDIWDYTEERWGHAQAVAYDAELAGRIQGIASGRVASRTAEEIAPGLRRALAEILPVDKRPATGH